MFYDEKCNNCGKQIQVAIFRNSGYCSENCRKILAGEKVNVFA